MTSQKDYKIFFRDVLLSTGEYTKEAVICFGDNEVYESAPQGLTVGLKEVCMVTKEEDNLNILSDPGIFDLSQDMFDTSVASRFSSQTSSALSMVFLRYSAQKKKFKSHELYKFIAQIYNKNSAFPKAIFNILNGGKHAGNGLSFCEFMIIPKESHILDNIKVATEVYLDLRDLLEYKFGAKNVLVGREGGFAPDISDVESAIGLISQAINKRNSGKCDIAIDVAANNFSQYCVSNENGYFEYKINDKNYTTDSLLTYYENLIKKFPNITYLEDPFHEEDFSGWKKLTAMFKDRILVVADDLTVSNILYLEKFKDCFNACILKINQIGNMTGLVKAYDFCVANNVRTIISQRSGETDSDIITHMSVGLGSDYIKAGAPARERIVKYNALIRLWHNFDNL